MSKASPSQTMTKILVRLPDELRDDLRTLAAARHRSITNLATLVLTDFVKAEKAASGQPS